MTHDCSVIATSTPRHAMHRLRPAPSVDGGVNPRIDGDDRKAGTRFAACDQPLLAIYRSDANGCPVALCQRRQPPKAGAVGQRLQRVAGQPSLAIKSDGWFPVAAGPPDPRTALCEDHIDSVTVSAPFMRGFSPPPTRQVHHVARVVVGLVLDAGRKRGLMAAYQSAYKMWDRSRRHSEDRQVSIKE